MRTASSTTPASEQPRIGRRQAVARLAALLAAPATVGLCHAAAQPGPVPQQVAPGVYLLRGTGGEVDAGNRGRIGNAGFIVGPNGVLVVDTGTSYRQGMALLDAVASVTAQPVRLAIVTHARQEFLFGMAAFRERGVPVWMQRDAAELAAARCGGCLKTLRRSLGDDEMRGTELLAPDRTFDRNADIGAAIGRKVRAISFGHSSGPGDTAVFDATSGALFAGGLVDVHRISDVQDSDLPGWHAALKTLQSMPLRQLVPGHGPVAPAAMALAAQRRYLDQLEHRVQQLLTRDAALSEVPDAAALPHYAGWDQYPLAHRRNAAMLYVRMERAELMRRP